MKFLFSFFLFFSLSLFASQIQQKTKKDANSIALLSANAVYHLNKEELPSILKKYLKDKEFIKALYIEENLENEKLFSFYKKNDAPVFNKPIPKNLKQLSIIEEDIVYNSETIGKVFLYYDNKVRLSVSEKQWLQKDFVLNYYHRKDLKPFEWKEAKGEVKGIFPELANLAFNEFGIKTKKNQCEHFDSSKCGFLVNNQALKTPGIAVMAYNKNAEEKFYFTKNSILKVPAVLFEHSSSNSIYLENTNDLKNKSVAVVKDSFIVEFLQKNYPMVKIITVEDIDDGLQQISSKRVDYFAANKISAQYLIKMKNLENIKVYRKLKFSFDYKIAVSKELSKIVVSILDKGLYNISQEEKNTIFYKWINIQIKKELDWAFISKIIVVFLVFILVIVIWNRKLKKTVEAKTIELKQLNENLESIIQEELKKNQQIQEQLFKSEKLASMGEMIGNIAHQWRQPLSVISSSSTSLKLKKELDMLEENDLENSCDIINENTQYLSKTIDDFRNFIKDDKKMESFYVDTIMQSCKNLVDSTIKNNYINIIYNIDKSLSIYGYKNELLQSFLNIINNSKDALKEKDIKEKYIFIDIFLKDDNVHITFKDNAGGIPENIINKIFEPYFTTKHQSQGTGLGLHMVYNIIVNGMDAKINVENTTYQYNDETYTGALFTIILKNPK